MSNITSTQSSDDETYEDASPLTEPIKHTQIEDITKNLHLEDNEETKEHKEKEQFVDCQGILYDEESQRDFEKTLTAEELLANQNKSNDLKKEGNELFKLEKYLEAIEIYTEALKICPLDKTTERAILFGNRAAANIQLQAKNAAIDDCSKALELNPTYMKALIRRAKLYEDTDKLDESLADFKKILEMDPGYAEARHALVRLPPKIDERNEKMKTEMLGKLKDLGNLVLKPFGLSTNNFQMQQDPSTGSYSINFKQNPGSA